MSLINDALKQAGKAQKENPPAAAPLEFRAAETSSRRAYTPPAILLGVLLLAFALGGVLVGVALQKGPTSAEPVKAHQSVEAAAGATDTAEPPAPSDKAAAIPASPSAQPDAAVTPTPPAVTPPTPPPTVPEPAPAPVVEAPKPTKPKLQGIFFNPSQPSAVVNGRTVYVGNHVGDFEVTRITQEFVYLVNGAQTNVLSLSD